jgi:DNA (cytosine-5)-methyltransferase 1
MHVIDLFAGAGGLSLGASRAGFTVSLAVEIDEPAVGVHKRNFPNSKHLEKSVSDLSGVNILEEANLSPGQLDGLIGGPPCQGFSTLGKRDVKDERNSLFRDFFRLVGETRPKFFLAENVPNILHPKFNDIRNEAMAEIPDDYIVLEPFVLNASDFGAATKRRRVFFIGYNPLHIHDLSVENFFDASSSVKTMVSDALIGLPEVISPNWENEGQGWQTVGDVPKTYFGTRLHGVVPEGVGDLDAFSRLTKSKQVSGCLGTHHSKEVESRYANLQQGKQDPISRTVRLKPDGFCPTLRAGTGKDKGSHQALRPIHPTQPRVITPREAARFQGFPDWFQFHETKWHSFRQIGNSVSPILAEAVLGVLYKNL